MIPRECTLQVPYQALQPETLRNLVEAFITREGTDYGAQEQTHDVKIEQVLRQLRSGKATIVYDEASDSVNIITIN